jgi:hypothetical protein
MATEYLTDALETVEALAELGMKMGLRSVTVADIRLEFYDRGPMMDELIEEETDEERKAREQKEFDELHYGSS